MRHLSEDVQPLEVVHYNSFIEINPENANIELVILPYYPNLHSLAKKEILFKDLNSFFDKCNIESTIAILTSPVLAADYCSDLQKEFHLKLWIAVKLRQPIEAEGKLAQQHAALLIITKQKKGLEHTKTRIGYNYCPACNKTTKDYGGKKHLYHEYGTLISDVWRDIAVDFSCYPEFIISRLKDLFGLPKYQKLNVYDLRQQYLPISDEQIFHPFNNIESIFHFRGRHGSMLINDDCLDALREIPDNSIDFAFSDPPYNIQKKYESWDDGIDILEYFNWCDKWLSELARILKPGRTLAVLNIPQWCIRHYKYLVKELDYQDWIAWEGLSLPVRMIMPAHYSVLCFSKGKPRDLPGLARSAHGDLEQRAIASLKEDYCIRAACINKRKKIKIEDTSLTSNLWWDIHRLKHNSRRVDHPCQLPPSFMYRLISLFTNEGEIVVDPFNGAGTTTLTSAQMNRIYVGIELSDYYNTIAQKRHLELEAGLNPFRKTDDTPKAKNSRVARLKQQKYAVTKKELQLEIREIAKKIHRIPNREDVVKHSKHPIEYFDNYFIDWGEATAAARTTGMQEDRPDQTISTSKQLLFFEDMVPEYGNKNSSKKRS